MSSNPFRRSRVPVEPDPASANLFVRVRPPKRVVIETPPHSPAETHDAQNGGRGLPATEPAARAASRDATSAPESMRAPDNPFARTLGTKETGSAVSQSSREEQEADARTQQRARPILDVDAFTNILLTGAPVPVGLSTSAGATRPQGSNNCSSTDPSSIFDPAYGLQPASPNCAYQDHDFASEDDEHSGLMGPGRSDDQAPPAPPKTKAKGPQTVSFADFDQSIPPGFMASGPSSDPVHTQNLTGILRSASSRPGTDLNKPLPPPPRDMIETTPPAVPETTTLPLQPNTMATPTSSAHIAKAVPPPPPSRKSGAGHGRARSSSNLSNTTQDSIVGTSADSGVSGPPNKLAPPPPPIRKHLHVIQPVSMPRDVVRGQQEGKPTPPPPPPPPPLRRYSSRTGRSSSNVSRQTSEDSTMSTTGITTQTSYPAPPPPPPPRRPHGSKRTSIDGPPSSFIRRLSGEHHRGTSFDSERSASISSLQKVAETGEGGEQVVVSSDSGQQKDTLAEMDAFQAELDALAQATKGK